MQSFSSCCKSSLENSLVASVQNTAIAMKKSGKRVHDDMNLLFFKKHSTMWRDLPPCLQAKYGEDAQREQERRATEPHGEISLARTNVDLTRVRVCSEVRDGGPFRVGACKFSASGRDSLNRMYGEKSYGGHGLRVFREMSQDAPQALNRFERDRDPKQSLLDLGGCRKFATTGRRCGCWQGGSRVLFHASEHCSLRRESLVLLWVLWVWPLTLGHIRTHTLASLTFSLTSLSSKATLSCTLLRARCILGIPGWAAVASGCHWLVSLRSSARGSRAHPQRFHEAPIL